VKLSLLLSLSILALVLCPQPATSESSDKPEDLAQKSAEAWLALTDAGKYAASWKEASRVLKDAVPREDWVSFLESARTPLGKLHSRKLLTSTYKKGSVGGLDAEFVIIKYNTIFENLPSAVETVTPMLESGGKWRVTSYYIKRIEPDEEP
jgi:hypothetical protein